MKITITGKIISYIKSIRSRKYPMYMYPKPYNVRKKILLPGIVTICLSMKVTIVGLQVTARLTILANVNLTLLQILSSH